jgi:hypothetical protein
MGNFRDLYESVKQNDKSTQKQNLSEDLNTDDPGWQKDVNLSKLDEKLEMVSDIKARTGIRDVLYTYGQVCAEQAIEVLVRERGDQISDAGQIRDKYAFDYQGDQYALSVQPNKITNTKSSFSLIALNETQKRAGIEDTFSMSGKHTPKSVGVEAARIIIDEFNL